MTIDEAIEYYINVATQRAIADEEMGVNDNSKWNETKFMTKKESKRIITDNLQLVEWLRELKELSKQMGDYKRLLKLAVEDIHELLVERKDISIRNTGRGCMVCNYAANCNCCEICTVINELKNWRHADEALKLIGDDTNE